MSFQQKCVFVAVVLALVTVWGQAVDICEICKCTRSQGEVKSVSCDCNAQDKVLNITDDKMMKVVHMTEFAVSNCSSVNFFKSAFRACHDLQRVTMSRVHTVTLNLGVFSALSSLHVEDVTDLRLAKKGFLGAAVKEITLHRSNISVLPSMALRDVTGLERVELKGVVVGKMEASAIKVIMAEDSQFIIDGCEVGTIEKDAVDIQASKVFISNSVFDEIRNDAVHVSASQCIEVMKNVFNVNSSIDGISVQSSRIDIKENTFNILPIGLLRRANVESSAISFTNNIVYNFTLMSNGVDLSTMLDLDDFKNNEVLCDCNLAKSVLAYKAFQSASAPRMIVEQNYCHLESDCKLSLQQLSDAQTLCEGDNSDLDDLCHSLPLPPTSHHDDDVPTRGGRAEVLPPATTELTVTTQETQVPDVHKEASHQIAAAGTAVNVSVLLTTLTVVASTMARFLAFYC